VNDYTECCCKPSQCWEPCGYLGKSDEHAKVVDEGFWTVGKTSENKVFLQSDDFTHDARLYIDGDFIDMKHKIRYAENLAKRLNGYMI